MHAVDVEVDFPKARHANLAGVSQRETGRYRWQLATLSSLSFGENDFNGLNSEIRAKHHIVG